jgi:hypothetical protein
MRHVHIGEKTFMKSNLISFELFLKVSFIVMSIKLNSESDKQNVLYFDIIAIPQEFQSE